MHLRTLYGWSSLGTSDLGRHDTRRVLPYPRNCFLRDVDSKSAPQHDAKLMHSRAERPTKRGLLIDYRARQRRRAISSSAPSRQT